MFLSNEVQQRLVELRRELHQYPENSGQEMQTAARIQAFLEQHAPPNRLLTQLGYYTQDPDGHAYSDHNRPEGHGMAAIYGQQREDAPVTLIRVDMDALPILEQNPHLSYCSQHEGIAHLCGHDLHSTIGTGLAIQLREFPPQGTVIILFQPDEERGLGAEAIMRDRRFQEVVAEYGGVDYVFALHNIPGEELGKVLCKEGAFTSAAESLVYQCELSPSDAPVALPEAGVSEYWHYAIHGNTAHAAEPENATSPAPMMAALSQALPQLNATLAPSAIWLKTAELGSDHAHGITAGDGSLGFAVQAPSHEDLAHARLALETKMQSLCEEGIRFHRDESVEAGVDTGPQSLAGPMVEMIPFIQRWNETERENPDEFARASITYVQAEVHHGRLNVTLRARTPQRMAEVKHTLHQEVTAHLQAQEAAITLHPLRIVEPFKANINDKAAVDCVEAGAAACELPYETMQNANDWGEDCGWLSFAKTEIKTSRPFMQGANFAMFGLGSGVNQPALHRPEFDAPDALIETGAVLFATIIAKAEAAFRKA